VRGRRGWWARLLTGTEGCDAWPRTTNQRAMGRFPEGLELGRRTAAPFRCCSDRWRNWEELAQKTGRSHACLATRGIALRRPSSYHRLL